MRSGKTAGRMDIMKKYLKDIYGATGCIEIKRDGTARLTVRIYTGKKIHDKVYKNERGARIAWGRMSD